MAVKKYTKRVAVKAAKKVATRSKKPFWRSSPRPQPHLAPNVASQRASSRRYFGERHKVV
jgi:hypothetical protein